MEWDLAWGTNHDRSHHVCHYQGVVSQHHDSQMAMWCQVLQVIKSFEIVGISGSQGSGSRVHHKVRVRAVCTKSAAFNQPFINSPLTSSLDKWRIVHHFPDPGTFSTRLRGDVQKCPSKNGFSLVKGEGSRHPPGQEFSGNFIINDAWQVGGRREVAGMNVWHRGGGFPISVS